MKNNGIFCIFVIRAGVRESEYSSHAKEKQLSVRARKAIARRFGHGANPDLYRHMTYENWIELRGVGESTAWELADYCRHFWRTS